MIFKEMDPDEVRKMLEGHENVLAPEVKKHEDYFATLQCTYCGGNCRPFVSKERLFETGSILPKYLAECNDCGHQFEPYTKIELCGPKRDPLERTDGLKSDQIHLLP
jgi:hypothetical protein